MNLQVSGEISLACSWRVTPLDVVTMKVKQQQAEVDHKEEILALLQEKYNITNPPVVSRPESPIAEAKLAIVPRHKSFRAMSDQDPDIKRIVTYRGRLSVKVTHQFWSRCGFALLVGVRSCCKARFDFHCKWCTESFVVALESNAISLPVSQAKAFASVQIIEGRNITPSNDLLQSFYTIDGYVQVTVNSESGPTSLMTKTARGNVGPIWNKVLTFADVALGNTFTVSLYDHKKLSPDVLLGQASASTHLCRLSLATFARGKRGDPLLHFLDTDFLLRQGQYLLGLSS